MSFGKWMGGILGWSAFGPLGGIIGFLIGTMFDAAANGSEGDFMRLTEEQSQQGNRNSFFISMLVLAAYIVKADGKVMHSEMELVRGMLRQNFGEDAAQQGDEMMRQLFREQDRQGTNVYRQNIQHDQEASDGTHCLCTGIPDHCEIKDARPDSGPLPAQKCRRPEDCCCCHRSHMRRSACHTDPGLR